ncbi:hypothetical protein EG68_02301 [Paragonimus skrjabini miyazakii]|uniref:EF-hand domain-containing protein n=1 Tax=Paragonimus skrjabini miyazakii TaxID=59628 RepID=A0A8S9ZBB8_9TREM|nr:hypothetical protein EG68_02301 [Paragonimus skrjabini miyazakii]
MLCKVYSQISLERFENASTVTYIWAHDLQATSSCSHQMLANRNHGQRMNRSHVEVSKEHEAMQKYEETSGIGNFYYPHISRKEFMKELKRIDEVVEQKIASLNGPKKHAQERNEDNSMVMDAHSHKTEKNRLSRGSAGESIRQDRTSISGWTSQRRHEPSGTLSFADSSAVAERIRRTQIWLQRLSLRQKKIKNRERPENLVDANESSVPQEIDDFLLPILKDKKSLEGRQTWMLGMFDFIGDEAFAYEKYITANIKQSTLRQMISTNSSVRFTLPLNLGDLKNMDPIEYLGKYCILSEQLDTIYTKMYTRLKAAGQDPIDNVIQSIKERLVDIFEPEQISEFKTLTDLDSREEISQMEFEALLGLAERLYGIQNLRKIMRTDMWLLCPNPLERVDFRCLGLRLSDHNLDCRLIHLLTRIECMDREAAEECCSVSFNEECGLSNSTKTAQRSVVVINL